MELRAATTLSTPLGDDQLTVCPDWSVSLGIPIAETLGLEVAYTGFYNFGADTHLGQVRNGAGVLLQFDPSIEFGVPGGTTGSVTLFPDRFVLDSSGLPTTGVRRDIDAGLSLETEGLMGYFTLRSVPLTGEMVFSNANSYLPATGVVEENSSDRLSLRVDGSVSSSPAESLLVEARVGVVGFRYPHRSAFDTSGALVGPTTSLLHVHGSVRLDWNPVGRLYLVIGTAGEYALSDEAWMSGWNYTGELSLQYRL